MASGSNEVFILLCSALVRLHLKYCVHLHSSQLNRDAEKLERVQKRAARLVTGLEHMTQKERMRFFSPAKEKLRSDLVEA